MVERAAAFWATLHSARMPPTRIATRAPTRRWYLTVPMSPTFSGSITGPGQVAQIGSGEVVLSGNSTFTGPTNVFSGILRVTGSITSPVTVNAGGALGGSGTVGPTTILAGGTLAPGDPSTLTVSGNLVFNTGSNYVVMVQGNASDRTNVTAGATLAGNFVAGFLGGALTNNYVVLSAAGGRTGAFDTFSTLGLPAFVTASLLYTPTDVDLRLNSGIANLPALHFGTSTRSPMRLISPSTMVAAPLRGCSA